MKAYTPTPEYGPASYDFDLNVRITAKDCFSAVVDSLVIIPVTLLLTTITKPIILSQRLAFGHLKKAAGSIMPGRLQEYI